MFFNSVNFTIPMQLNVFSRVWTVLTWIFRENKKDMPRNVHNSRVFSQEKCYNNEDQEHTSYKCSIPCALAHNILFLVVTVILSLIKQFLCNSIEKTFFYRSCQYMCRYAKSWTTNSILFLLLEALLYKWII